MSSGYEVVSYPLTDQLSEEEVIAEDEKPEKAGKDDDGGEWSEGSYLSLRGDMIVTSLPSFWLRVATTSMFLWMPLCLWRLW